LLFGNILTALLDYNYAEKLDIFQYMLLQYLTSVNKVITRDLHTASQGLQTEGFFVYTLPLAVVKQTKQQVSSYIPV